MMSLDPLEQTDSSDQASRSGQSSQPDQVSQPNQVNQPNQGGLESQEHSKDQSNSQSLREQGQSCPDAGEAFSSFADTIAALRAPDGCPWDREQTHDSIAHNMIEEAYEAVDAIEQHDTTHLREELGDVLLQVVLQSQIASDAGEFDIADVCRDVNEKMIRRHPHVFGDKEATSASDVLDIWDKVKLAERKNAAGQNEITAQKAAGQNNVVEQNVARQNAAGQNGAVVQKDTEQQAIAEPEGLLDSIPVSFPALMQASKISRKAVSVGFEWDSVEAVWEKVEEEIAEFKQACAEGDARAMELEFGDVLFTLVNVARKVKVDPESALRATCRKFRERWAFMEGAAWASGKNIEDLSMDELQELWDQAKLMQRVRVEAQNQQVCTEAQNAETQNAETQNEGSHA